MTVVFNIAMQSCFDFQNHLLFFVAETTRQDYSKVSSKLIDDDYQDTAHIRDSFCTIPIITLPVPINRYNIVLLWENVPYHNHDNFIRRK